MARLRVYGNEYPQQVEEIRTRSHSGKGARQQYTIDVGMGGYVVSNGLVLLHAPVLATYGADPCVILVVHCRNGRGALGHFAGAGDAPDSVLRAVTTMHRQLLHPNTLDAIVIAGGGVVAGDGYRSRVLDQVRGYAGRHVDVRWPVQNGKDVRCSYSSAAYMPTVHKLALADRKLVHGTASSVFREIGY